MNIRQNGYTHGGKAALHTPHTIKRVKRLEFVQLSLESILLCTASTPSSLHVDAGLSSVSPRKITPFPPMRPFRFRPLALLVLLPYSDLLVVLLHLPSSEGINRVDAFITPEEACAEFAPGSYPSSSWTLDTCIDVWTRFVGTVPNGQHQRTRLADVWREAASKLRQVGSSCLVAPGTNLDGAGSTTIRHLAAWMFADEMGCDWVTPDWGERKVDREDGTTGVVYCHRTATAGEMDMSKNAAERQAMRRCSVIDWVSYFQFDVPSVDQPEGGDLKIIQASY